MSLFWTMCGIRTRLIRDFAGTAGPGLGGPHRVLTRTSPGLRGISVALLLLLGVPGSSLAQEAASAERVSEEDVRVLEAAVERAETAAEQASLALRALDEAERKKRRRKERPGAYFGAAFFYAAENFDDRIIVKSSLGGAALVGYRFAPLVAAELRYEGFNGFDLKGSSGRARIEASALTLNAKVYPFKGEIQPYVGAGLGAFFVKQKSVFNDGSRLRNSQSDFAFRVAAGVDLWLTDSLLLNAEAAYLAPSDDLSNLESTILSTGLIYRF